MFYTSSKASGSNIYEDNGKFFRIIGLVQLVEDQTKLRMALGLKYIPYSSNLVWIDNFLLLKL